MTLGAGTRRLDRWRLAAPLAGLALVAGAWAAPSAAAQEEPAIRISLRAVDATDPEAITLVASSSAGLAALDEAEVRENGDVVDAEPVDLADSGFRSNLVLVFDTSGSTDANALLTTARAALSDALVDLPGGPRVAVVTAGGAVQVQQGLTTDLAQVSEAIGELTPGGEGAVLAGVVRAAGLATDEGVIPTVVLVTDGVESSSTSVEVARGALFDDGAALFVVGLQDGGLDEGAFRDLAERSGGGLRTTGDVDELDGLLAETLEEAAGLRALRYASEAGAGVQDLVLTAGGSTIEASYISGSELIGARRVAPRPAVEPGGVAFFRTDLGRSLGFAAALLASALFAYGVILLFVRDQTALSQVLQPYADDYRADKGDDDDEGGFTQTAFLQRAVQITEGFAERQGILVKLERSLERADLPLRAGEALVVYGAVVILILVAVLVLLQNLLGTLIVGGLAALIPLAALNFLASRKKRAFEGLLPDTLQLLSSTLRAGYSMMQGVEAVSQEAAEPMGKELRRVVTEARLGRSLEESLDAVAERMDSKDFAWAVMAIRIQREVGGNLSELLMTVAETMTQRERLRRDISALTAEGRISAYVLIALPLGLGGFLYTVNPDYIGRLFDVSLGQVMLAFAVLGIGVGYAWMMKIIKIEI